jgi:uncharacterized protein YbaP (TraB family)
MPPRTRRLLFLALFLGFLAPLAQAADAPAQLPTTVLDTVVVSGKQPGPGLWKVSRDGHVMWLLGTISPLPKRMEWASKEVEETVADSQELLLPPSASMKVEGAMLGGIFLIPSLMKARNNPDGRRLAEVLPSADYARWTRLKQKYMGRDRGVEKRRPMLAAAELQDEALDDEDLSTRNIAQQVAERAARKHDLKITTPNVKFVLKDAKKLLRDFRDTPMEDLECFRLTLDRVEHNIDSMKLRANAWALGEVEILRSLPYTDNFRACIDAVIETRVAKESGLDNLDAKLSSAWMDAADQALARNESTFAVLPLSLMLREGGFLAQLEARGYRVEAPGDAEESDEPDATTTSTATQATSSGPAG